tara:strand:+ start:8611 stop:9624 length:1014 start_codon:yes stop_codon:yes gene_type:complete
MANIPLTPNGFEATFAYSERQNAWTTRYSFVPTCYASSGDEMLSFKDDSGTAWLHDKNSARNEFYGVKNKSRIELCFNDDPSSVKIFKSVSLETNRATWSYVFSTNEEYDDSNNQESLLINKVINDKEGFKYIEVPRSSLNSSANIIPVPSATSGIDVFDFLEVLEGSTLEGATVNNVLVEIDLDPLEVSSFPAAPFGSSVILLASFDDPDLSGQLQTLSSFCSVTPPFAVLGGALFGFDINIVSINNGVMTLSLALPLLISEDVNFAELYLLAFNQYLTTASNLFAVSPAEINGDEMRGPYLNLRLESASSKPLELHSINAEYAFSKLDKGLNQNA